MVASMIVAQALVQLDAGVDFTTAEIVGSIDGFPVLAVAAIWMLARLLGHIAEDTTWRVANIIGVSSTSHAEHR
jgi:hypothetical protein